MENEQKIVQAGLSQDTQKEGITLSKVDENKLEDEPRTLGISCQLDKLSWKIWGSNEKVTESQTSGLRNHIKSKNMGKKDKSRTG